MRATCDFHLFLDNLADGSPDGGTLSNSYRSRVVSANHGDLGSGPSLTQ